MGIRIVLTGPRGTLINSSFRIGAAASGNQMSGISAILDSGFHRNDGKVLDRGSPKLESGCNSNGPALVLCHGLPCFSKGKVVLPAS